MTTYGSEISAALESLIYDSVKAAESDYDFTQFDAVLIVHAGVGEESDITGSTPNDIWSLYYQSGGGICQNGTGPCLGTKLKGDITINEGIIMPQTDSRPRLIP
jgi:hypothetical protein